MRGIHRDRWIPRTKGQLRGKCFHLMTSSWTRTVFFLIRSIDTPYLAYEHDDVIKCKYFPRNWPFVRGIPWSPVNSPHKVQCCGNTYFNTKAGYRFVHWKQSKITEMNTFQLTNSTRMVLQTDILHNMYWSTPSRVYPTWPSTSNVEISEIFLSF